MNQVLFVEELDVEQVPFLNKEQGSGTSSYLRKWTGDGTSSVEKTDYPNTESIHYTYNVSHWCKFSKWWTKFLGGYESACNVLSVPSRTRLFCVTSDWVWACLEVVKLFAHHSSVHRIVFIETINILKHNNTCNSVIQVIIPHVWPACSTCRMICSENRSRISVQNEHISNTVKPILLIVVCPVITDECWLKNVCHILTNRSAYKL